MPFVRVVVIALIAKIALAALLGAIAFTLVITGAGMGAQSVAVRLGYGLAMLAPVVGVPLAIYSVWKRAEVAHRTLALAAGIVTAAVLLVPVPDVPGTSILDAVAPDLGFYLFEGPRGCANHASCGPGRLCARKGSSRDHQCIGPIKSSCSSPGDCPPGTRCACICAPASPPSQSHPQKGAHCELECVPSALADQVSPQYFCDLGRRLGPEPTLENPGELLLTYPTIAGPPRRVRLLCDWKWREGFVPADFVKDNHGRSIPLTAKVLPLDVADGGWLVVEGEFRLKRGSMPGFELADQTVRRATAEEEQLAGFEASPGGPSFLEAGYQDPDAPLGGPFRDHGRGSETGDSELSMKVEAHPINQSSTILATVVVVNRREEPVTIERIAVNGSVVADRNALFTLPPRSMGRWKGTVELPTWRGQLALRFEADTSAGTLNAGTSVHEPTEVPSPAPRLPW